MERQRFLNINMLDGIDKLLNIDHEIIKTEGQAIITA